MRLDTVLRRAPAVAAAGIAVVLLAACSSSGSGGASSGPPRSGGAEQVTTTTQPRPAGPTADVGAELSGGRGVFVASAVPAGPALEAAGWEQHEFVASGTATSYDTGGPLGPDGRWPFRPSGSAPYRTRVIVRRPTDPSAASGTVVVEWLNVSSGFDADPDWQSLHEELTRRGVVWVGVSAQRIGVNGGGVAVSTPEGAAAGAGKGLKNLDPDRYGSLDHPGDGFAYDIFTQVARAVRAGAPFLGGARADHVIAAGESQSAFALVTYVNGVQPLTLAFDGFLVHSRGASALPAAVEPGKAAGTIDAVVGEPTIFRTDTTVPVLELQTETDVTGFFGAYKARQDDTDRFRLWEVAGTAHADKHLIGDRSESMGCGAINDAPMHVVTKAAFRALTAWVVDGTAPPTAPRLELTAGHELARDADGIVLGGIRTPTVDVPVDVLSGAPGPNASLICLLSGSTTPLPADVLAARYPSRADYQARFAASADATITAGFALPDDRDALMAYAHPERLSG